MESSADLYLPAVQDAEQRRERHRVPLLAGDHVRVRPAAPPVHAVLLHREEVAEPDVAVACRILEQGVSSVGLEAHDVTQRPTAAGPWVAEFPGALARADAALPGREVVEWNVDRRGEEGAGCRVQDAP